MNREDTPLLAVIQMQSGESWPDNREQAGRRIAEAAQAGARLVVLPENFGFMGACEAKRLALAETPGAGPMQAFLAESAARHGLWLVGGTLGLREPGQKRVRAATLVYDDSGHLRARYDKMHLFDVDLPQGGERYRESDSFAPGMAPVGVDTPFGRLGLAICYDLRFPELFRYYAQDGVELIVLPAAFTETTGRAHWEVLLRARAIENQCLVVAANQCGSHPGDRRTWGHSLIVNAWGEVMADAGRREGMALARFDRPAQRELRTRFPVLTHRRERLTSR
ncbi:MAG: carbon-nitrogen hydrolase family protein [Halothiobacillaceae bacterium]|nr:carbon-nitrogen hydrolase family protein [Halothiobacillaceae bacterium]